MVNGVSGINAGTNVESIKQIMQEVVQEVLDEKDTQMGQQEDAVDDEAALVDATTDNSVDSNKNLTVFAYVIKAISSMMTSMLEAMLKLQNISQNEENSTNEQYVMSKEERDYLNRNPNFIKDLILQEKSPGVFEKIDYLDSSMRPWEYAEYEAEKFMNLGRARMEVSDDEVNQYLQAHPNVIKEAIASENRDS